MNPYLIIGAILALLLTATGSFYEGYSYAETKQDAEMLEDLKLVQERSDMLSVRLSASEARVITQTVEVIKYVPKVTAGKPCLSADAVSLLQPGSSDSTASTPPAEDATPVASDTDIAYWVADANRYYETCAVRLNTLIDWHSERSIPR